MKTQREYSINRVLNEELRGRKSGPIPAKNKYNRDREKRETEELIRDAEEEM